MTMNRSSMTQKMQLSLIYRSWNGLGENGTMGSLDKLDAA